MEITRLWLVHKVDVTRSISPNYCMSGGNRRDTAINWSCLGSSQGDRAVWPCTPHFLPPTHPSLQSHSFCDDEKARWCHLNDNDGCKLSGHIQSIINPLSIPSYPFTRPLRSISTHSHYVSVTFAHPMPVSHRYASHWWLQSTHIRDWKKELPFLTSTATRTPLQTIW